jgi:eukaryotic-like serine/threonine-protein kinase
MGILTQHMYKAPVPIRALVPQPQEVPPGLEAIVLKCLSKRAEHRYQSMGELIEDLDKLRDGHVPNAVPELMSRSGGFNVPADYFAKPQMPEPVPASPRGRREKSRWPLVAGLSGIVAAVAIVGGIFAKSSQSGAQPSAALTARPEPVKAASASAPVLPAAPPTKQVALAVVPPEAHVFDGDEDLGTSPVLLTVAEGRALKLTARLEGYKDLEFVIDGSSGREIAKLERLPAKVGHARPQPKKPAEPTKAEPRKNLGGGEIVDPWRK